MTAADTDSAGKSPSRWTDWRNFSTELKIFLALIIGLAPLGVLGVYATLEGSERADRSRIGLINVASSEMARLLSNEFAADRAVVRRSLVGVQLADLFPEEARRVCEDVRLAIGISDVSAPRIYIVSSSFSRELCADGPTDYFTPQTAPAVPVEGLFAIDTEENRLLSSVRFEEADEPYSAVLSYNTDSLAVIAEKDIVDLPSHELAIAGPDARLGLIDDLDAVGPRMTEVIERPIGQTGYGIELTTLRSVLTRNEILSLIAPVAIWFLGAFLSWALLSFLIMRPLSRLHRSVTSYKPGAVFVRPKRRMAMAREIAQLEEDFSELSETVAEDKAELAKGLERQTALTREVHHRVKNNLQVIGSLINLHSRATEDIDARRAYRTIQRRVDAISVVHRNHMAGGEESPGHSLRPLLSEMASNLRASGLDDEDFPPISVDVDTLYVTQDVAVPIAFLVTELAELSSKCDATKPVAISVKRHDDDESIACLVVQSEGLIVCDALNDLLLTRYERILTGLSRQLRKPFDHDPHTGRYAIEVPILDDPHPPEL